MKGHPAYLTKMINSYVVQLKKDNPLYGVPIKNVGNLDPGEKTSAFV